MSNRDMERRKEEKVATKEEGEAKMEKEVIEEICYPCVRKSKRERLTLSLSLSYRCL